MFLVSDIVTFSIQRLYKKTPADIISMKPSKPMHVDVCAIVSTLMERHGEIGAHNMVGLPPVIPNLSMVSSFSSQDSFQSRQVAETLLCAPNEITKHPMEPVFIRP